MRPRRAGDDLFVDARGFLRRRPDFEGEAQETAGGERATARGAKKGKKGGKKGGKKKKGKAGAKKGTSASPSPTRGKTPPAGGTRLGAASGGGGGGGGGGQLSVEAVEDVAMERVREIGDTLRAREAVHNEMAETMNKANESLLDARRGAASALSTCWLCSGWRPVRGGARARRCQRAQQSV